MLAALGADVVKIEPPGGDPYRRQGTEWSNGESVLFMSLNAGKRSVALDFRTPAGREVLDRLIAAADFFVENSRPGSLTRHGLDWDSLHERYPALMFGSISGYGDVGPDARKGGFDLIVQAESGLMSVTGSSEAGPVKVGAPVLDVGAGLAARSGWSPRTSSGSRPGAGASSRRRCSSSPSPAWVRLRPGTSPPVSCRACSVPTRLLSPLMGAFAQRTAGS